MDQVLLQGFIGLVNHEILLLLVKVKCRTSTEGSHDGIQERFLGFSTPTTQKLLLFWDF
jgi:hypothetical protein